MLTHELTRLKQELDGPRLSRWRSTLGIAVASAVLGSFDDPPSERNGRACRLIKHRSRSPSQAPT
jgi:hypothetical protein